MLVKAFCSEVFYENRDRSLARHPITDFAQNIRYKKRKEKEII
jgi:hypothetical protein